MSDFFSQIFGEGCDSENKTLSLNWLTNQISYLETTSLKLHDLDVKCGICFHISYTQNKVTFIFAYLQLATETTKECKLFQD